MKTRKILTYAASIAALAVAAKCVDHAVMSEESHQAALEARPDDASGPAVVVKKSPG